MRDRIVNDILAQIEDGATAAISVPAMTAGGQSVERFRIHYADMIGGGVARIEVDCSPINQRRSTHGVKVYGVDPTEADAIAAAVLDGLDAALDLARNVQ